MADVRQALRRALFDLQAYGRHFPGCEHKPCRCGLERACQQAELALNGRVSAGAGRVAPPAPPLPGEEPHPHG